MNIAKIRTNFHELQSEIEWWSIPKTPWNDKIYHICDSKQVEDERHFKYDSKQVEDESHFLLD